MLSLDRLISLVFSFRFLLYLKPKVILYRFIDMVAHVSISEVSRPHRCPMLQTRAVRLAHCVIIPMRFPKVLSVWGGGGGAAYTIFKALCMNKSGISEDENDVGM